MRIPIVLILGVLAVCAVNGSVIPDKALSASLQDVLYEDEFIIALSNIKDRRKHFTGTIETLLAVKYHGTKTKLVLLLDRRTKRVILESLDHSGRRSASHVNVDSLAVNTPLQSLIILVHQAQPNPRVDVYVDCIYEGSIPFKKTFRDIAQTEDSSSVEVLRERKCRLKVYQSATITEVLRKEQCPDNLDDMKQPSIFDTGVPKTQPIDSDKNETKSIDRSDGIDTSDGMNGGGSSIPDQDNGLPSSGKKHPWDHKKPFDKKDHRDRPSDRDRSKKKDSSGHPEDKSKSDKYGPNDSFDPFSPAKSSDTDDYSDGSRPAKPDQSSSRLDKPDQSGPTKQPNESGPYDSNENPFSSDESVEFGSSKSPKRPGRSPYYGQDKYSYPSQVDTPDSSDESSAKRVPRRGDIGIQSLDERVCQTDDQIVKTLNELINATRKLWRELELNRMETQHLRHLIENCAACRTPIVTTPQPSTCDHNSPCYPGVDCRNTPSGPECGPCRRGYTGDGRICSKIHVITCIQRPCFQGVRCYDDDNDGYRCGRCPSGYVGDGVKCERMRNPCDHHPCHPEVKCYPTHSPPYFK